VNRTLHRVVAACLLVALLHAAPAAAEVIDKIAIEGEGPAAKVRVRLTGPVHYLRDYVSIEGEIVNVYLRAMAPQVFGDTSVPDEVKRFRGNGVVPGFTARVTLDPRCDQTLNPVCIVIQFERPARCRIRLGEDRRSLVLDFPAASNGQRRP
jgi:hypothetical protein